MFERSGSLRQSSVKATIGLGGAFVEDGEYAGALRACAKRPRISVPRASGDGPMRAILPSARLPRGKASETSRGKEMLSFCAWRTVHCQNLPDSQADFQLLSWPDCQTGDFQDANTARVLVRPKSGILAQ